MRRRQNPRLSQTGRCRVGPRTRRLIRALVIFQYTPYYDRRREAPAVRVASYFFFFVICWHQSDHEGLYFSMNSSSIRLCAGCTPASQRSSRTYFE